MRNSLVYVSVGMIAGSVGILSGFEPARANCYELIGCSNQDYYKTSDLMQLGCQPLWEVRNWIYKERGYCFKSPKAIKGFGNAGCLYDEIVQVPLSMVERANVKTIKKAETKKGC